MKTVLVTLKLVDAEIEALDYCMRRCRYDSRSSAIRHALGMLFELTKLPKKIDLKIESQRRLHKPRLSSQVKKSLIDSTTKPKRKRKAKEELPLFQ